MTPGAAFFLGAAAVLGLASGQQFDIDQPCEALAAHGLSCFQDCIERGDRLKAMRDRIVGR